MDYDFNPGDIVTAVNRTSKPLTWRFNSIEYTLRPHQERPMNLVHVQHGIRRHPIMGTYDPTYEHQHQSLIGIKEMADRYPCTPVEQSDNPEAIDRSKLPPERQNAERVKVGWGQEDAAMARGVPMPHDAGFAGAMPDK